MSSWRREPGRQKYGAAFLGRQRRRISRRSLITRVGANVSYVLDYAGGARSAIEERLALAEVQQHTLEAARLTLAGNVVLQALADCIGARTAAGGAKHRG